MQEHVIAYMGGRMEKGKVVAGLARILCRLRPGLDPLLIVRHMGECYATGSLRQRARDACKVFSGHHMRHVSLFLCQRPI
jgi:hypothetical protein